MSGARIGSCATGKAPKTAGHFSWFDPGEQPSTDHHYYITFSNACQTVDKSFTQFPGENLPPVNFAVRGRILPVLGEIFLDYIPFYLPQAKENPP